MPNDEGKPEYLKELERKGPVPRSDNFDHSDYVWTGGDGELDPEELIQGDGNDVNGPNPQLILLLSALIKGATPEATFAEYSARLRHAVGAVTGLSVPGRSEDDDHVALLEVAWAYNKALFEAQTVTVGSVKLRPIVREAVNRRFPNIERDRGVPIYVSSSLSRVTMSQNPPLCDTANWFHRR